MFIFSSVNLQLKNSQRLHSHGSAINNKKLKFPQKSTKKFVTETLSNIARKGINWKRFIHNYMEHHRLNP